MPSSKQRLEVFAGTRAKTSGGLRKSDLTKNKRGKIVSKKKSQQAANQNNLGDHLRQKGKKMPKDEMLHAKKSGKKKAGGAPGKVEPKPKAAPKPPVKSPPKPAPKAAPKPKEQPAKKAAPQKKPAKGKVIKKRKANVNPITGQLRDPEAKTKVSVDNIRRRGRVRDKWAGF